MPEVVEDPYNRIDIGRTVSVSWPDGDGPEVESHGKKGRLLSVRLTYRAGNRWTDEAFETAFTWDSGSASIEWAWYTKGGLGARRQLYATVPEVEALLKEHQPPTTVRVVETAL